MNCTECQSNNTRIIDGEIVCTQCGMVLEETFEHTSAERTAPSIPALSIAGTFQYEGRIITTGWLFSTRQKSLYETKRRLRAIAERLHLPERAMKESILLFTKSQQQGLLKGRDATSILYACVYAACNIHEMPKTPLEILAHTTTSKVAMLRAYRLLCRSLGLQHQPIKPGALIPRFGSRLHLKQATISAAGTIAEQHPAPARHPETTAAAALYLAAAQCGELRTQRQIANTTGVIEVTIRKRVRELLL